MTSYCLNDMFSLLNTNAYVLNVEQVFIPFQRLPAASEFYQHLSQLQIATLTLKLECISFLTKP